MIYFTVPSGIKTWDLSDHIPYLNLGYHLAFGLYEIDFSQFLSELDVFVFDHGEERSLLNLNGTIPVEYRGNSYNIPVCFWILHDYPTSPPMAFVRPTHVRQHLIKLIVILN